MAKAVKPGTLAYYGAFVHDKFDGGPATVGRANTGRSRLHPEDAVESKDPGLFALSNGAVDLSKVPANRARYMRTEHEDAAELSARLKRDRRHEGRSARRNAAKRARRKAATAL